MISVIVPAYNAENYVEECLASILAQTYSDFELIIIDDGSTDSTGDICDRFQKTDSRVNVVHQKNAGVSQSRNNGIRLSKGEFVCFVDADDWIEPSYLQSFMDVMEDRQPDLLLQGLVEHEGTKPIRSVSFQPCIYSNMEDFMRDGLHLFRGPYCKLFKKSIICMYALTFPPQISYGEDSIFYLSYLLHCREIQTLPSSFYCYRKNVSNSLSSCTHAPQQMLDFLEMNEALYRQLRESTAVGGGHSSVITTMSTYKGIIQTCIARSEREDALYIMRRIRESPLLDFKKVQAHSLRDVIFKLYLLYLPFCITFFLIKNINKTRNKKV